MNCVAKSFRAAANTRCSMAVEQMTAAWQAALQDGLDVLSDLDESELQGTTDFQGKATFWRLPADSGAER